MVSPEPTGCIVRSNSLSRMGLPGSWVHIEISGKHTEQERPNWNLRDPGDEGKSKRRAVKAGWESDQLKFKIAATGSARDHQSIAEILGAVYR